MSRSIAASTNPPRRAARGSARVPVPLPRPVGVAASLTRAGLARLWERRRLRIVLLALLVALGLLGGGLWLLRHSSLTAVEHVQVRGLTKTLPGDQASAIEAALGGAARRMSTLAVEPAALQAAVAAYPIVRSVSARTSFPHGLRIDVVEQPPVAGLTVNGVRTAVAADGVVLGPGYLTGALPQLSAPKNAGPTSLPASGGSLHGAPLLAALSVLGAAPTQLAPAITRVYVGSKGVTLALRGGVLAYFGDATRPHAKWLSLARVLADPGSRGAIYVDVRLPERPAAGFAPGTRPPGAGGESEASGTSDPNTAAELAAGLDAAVGGGAGAAGAGAGAGAGVGAGSGEAAKARAGESSSEARSAGAGSGQSGSAETGSSEAGSGAGAAGGSASGSAGEAGGEASSG